MLFSDCGNDQYFCLASMCNNEGKKGFFNEFDIGIFFLNVVKVLLKCELLLEDW